MNRKLVKGSRFFFGGCTSVAQRTGAKVSQKVAGWSPVTSTIMNKDNKIRFAYIAGKNHGRVDITPEQLNQVMKILYG